MRERRAGGIVLVLGAAIACGRERPAGEIVGERRPAAVVTVESAQETARVEVFARAMARGAEPEKHILFGNLDVHATYSIDAFIYSLPLFAREGAHPPADACDFARYCAAVDFFALTPWW